MEYGITNRWGCDKPKEREKERGRTERKREREDERERERSKARTRERESERERERNPATFPGTPGSSMEYGRTNRWGFDSERGPIVKSSA
eukprot:1361606-Amorphochlora_amoeboformis.AAC.1